MDLYYQSVGKGMSDISPIGQAIYDSFYSFDNQCNIELFITYLTSKLYEEKYHPVSVNILVIIMLILINLHLI